MDFFNDYDTQTSRTVNAEQLYERRKSKRRLLHGHVLLGIAGTRMIGGQMIDVGTSGLSVIVPTQLDQGQGCRVFFSIPLGSDKVSIDCIGIVVSCVCIAEGFRVGMRFIISDIHVQKALEQFLSELPGTPVVAWAISEPAESNEPMVQLDPIAVVSFSDTQYPKTVRIADLGKL